MKKVILDKIRCVVVGGGGHGRVLVDTIRSSGCAEAYVVVDKDPSLWNSTVLGVPVRGGDEVLEHLPGEKVTHFVVGVGGVGNNDVRLHLYERCLRLGLKPLKVIHAMAICSPSAHIGEGTVVFPGAIVNACVQLGANVIVNSGAIVEHDCVVADHVHIATGAKLCGAVKVGMSAHIGAGSVVKEGIVIGDAAVVGAGSVVVRNVFPRMVVKGVPAK